MPADWQSSDERLSLYHKDCREVDLAPDSIDAIATDPPYGLKFMGKEWDYGVPGVEFWKRFLIAAKPGAHLLAFGGTRTFHRLVCAIEDAGWEIRDSVGWTYGCLDEQTQFVTPDGAKPYHKAVVGDPVLCYNAETREYSYQPIQGVVVYDYSDTAYRLVGDHGVQVVSRNHRCLVERGGREAFRLAETLQQQASIPILEDLPALQQALRSTQQESGCQKQDVQQVVCRRDEQAAETAAHADRAAESHLDSMCCLWSRGVEAQLLAEEGYDAHLQLPLQRSTERQGVDPTQPQGEGALGRVGKKGASGTHDGCQQSIVEGRCNISQPQGSLLHPKNTVCEMPDGVHGYGPERRLCGGIPSLGSSGDGSRPVEVRIGASHQPRCNGQQTREPNALCNQWSTQSIRAWGGHKASMVRVEPIHYTGKVWCLKVPTGCFVAVRNGLAFPTGNSGFPKSADVSKMLDKEAGAERELGPKRISADGTVAHDRSGARHEGYERPWRGDPEAVDRNTRVSYPATDAARQWQGWGTALKPAWEPICLARKPFKGTVAQNVQRYGTGAIHIDGCRVPHDEECRLMAASQANIDHPSEKHRQAGRRQPTLELKPSGRFPANLIHDGSDEVLELFPVSGPSKSRRGKRSGKESGRYGRFDGQDDVVMGHDDCGGSAARFFYCAKASRKERGEGNKHPTVKPLSLMRYLVRLITPPNGIVFDPFMGSGTTGLACIDEGFRFVGAELDKESFDTAVNRLLTPR